MHQLPTDRHPHSHIRYTRRTLHHWQTGDAHRACSIRNNHCTECTARQAADLQIQELGEIRGINCIGDDHDGICGAVNFNVA